MAQNTFLLLRIQLIIQRIIGADIMMAFDECTPFPCDHKMPRKSLSLTHRWLDRAITRFKETEPFWDMIRCCFLSFREVLLMISVKNQLKMLRQCNMAGISYWRIICCEPAEEMYRIIEIVNEILPEDKPRYLMGVGDACKYS